VKLSDDKDKLSREYWELPYKPIGEMDKDDEAEGNIPAEYYVLWKEYQAIEGDEAKEAFLEAHPELTKDWRAEYRLNNPEQDAMLAFWGYGGKLQSLEAYNKVAQWAEEYGIPLEQLGLGLPPPQLVDKYFNYTSIVSQTSGNSPEAKLFRLENPKWDEWGQENWGWKPIEQRLEEVEIAVNYKKEDQEYEAIQMDDLSAQREARERYLQQHPDYAIARRRREAYQMELPDELIPQYVEYSQLPNWGYWKDRYRLEHPQLNKAISEALNLLPVQADKVPAEPYDQLYEQYYEQFKEYEALTDDESRDKYLESNPAFAEAWRRRQAYGLFFSEEYIDNYVEYYSLPEAGHDRERYLQANPEFYDLMFEKLEWSQRIDFSKIPSERFEQVYNEVYSKMPKGNLRYEFRGKNAWFDKEGVRLGYWKPYQSRKRSTEETNKWLSLLEDWQAKMAEIEKILEEVR